MGHVRDMLASRGTRIRRMDLRMFSFSMLGVGSGGIAPSTSIAGRDNSLVASDSASASSALLPSVLGLLWLTSQYPRSTSPCGRK